MYNSITSTAGLTLYKIIIKFASAGCLITLGTSQVAASTQLSLLLKQILNINNKSHFYKL